MWCGVCDWRGGCCYGIIECCGSSLFALIFASIRYSLNLIFISTLYLIYPRLSSLFFMLVSTAHTILGTPLYMSACKSKKGREHWLKKGEGQGYHSRVISCKSCVPIGTPISVFLLELLFLKSSRINSFFNRNVGKFSTKSYLNFNFKTSIKKIKQIIRETEKNEKDGGV